jgi:uncharacterized protein (UPF0261 family)
MVNFGTPESVPPPVYRATTLSLEPGRHSDANRPGRKPGTRKNGRIIAGKVNQSTGPVTVLLPLGGVSQLDSIQGDFWSPAADQALFDSIREHLRPDIPVINVAANINDHTFADRAMETLLDLIRAKDSSPSHRLSTG